MNTARTQTIPAGPPQGWRPPSVAELAPYFPALEIERFLAQGGMGAVYLAQQRSLERRVVLKVLPPETGADPEIAARFTREARVLARLREPGIVAIHDFGLSEGGHLYLILEWEEGGDLRRWAQGRTVSVAEALSIGESISASLAAAHAERIIHGDIKPDNIFIDGKGRLKIGDFGLADFRGAGHAVYHTPGYTAPEILTGRALPSPRSDLYAVGATMFELLFKCIPPSDAEARAAFLRTLPPPAARVIAQALEEHPALRPVTATAYRAALANALRQPAARPAARAATVRRHPRVVRFVRLVPQQSGTKFARFGAWWKPVLGAIVIFFAAIWLLTKAAPTPAAATTNKTADPPAANSVPPSSSTNTEAATTIDALREHARMLKSRSNGASEEQMKRAGPKPEARAGGVIPIMLESIQAMKLKELKAKSITSWGNLDYEEVDGTVYWTGTVQCMVKNSLFGPQPTEVMALMKDNQVVKWIYTGSREPVQ